MSDDHSPVKEKESVDHIESHSPHLPKPRTAEERQAALTKALAVDPGVNRWSARALRMYLLALVIFCCSGDTGFDSTVMGGINSMKQFQNYFGMTGAGAKTSIIFGIYTIGSLVGVVPAAYFPDKLGRRWTMFLGNITLIVGAIITATTTSMATLIGGRFLTGLGVSVAGAAAKSYLAELSPPQTRGRYLGVLNSFYYVGQMVATGMMVPTGRYDNEYSWRLPLYIQAVPAFVNVALILFLPESPRWLYAQGKSDEARAILARYHSSTGDTHSPLVNLEMEEIEEKILLDGADKRWWDFRPLFKTRGDRKRTWQVIMIGAFGQLSGNGLITYFLPNLLKMAGIIDQNQVLTLNFVNSITSFLGALTGSALIDRFGRRPLLLTSTGTLVAFLAIISGLLSDPTTSLERQNAGITFIYLFMVIFSFGWTPMQALYPAEILSYSVRAKGLAFLNIITQGSSCINTFGLPFALEGIGWKIYIIFAIWDLFEWLVIYFTSPETKGLTLEEIDHLFEQENPRDYSLQHKFAFKAQPAAA